jgi:hypothetical protein
VQVTSGAGKQRAQLIANQEGAMAAVYNNQGQPICTMNPDEEGNGIVGAWSRSDGGQALRGADSKPGDGESSNN